MRTESIAQLVPTAQEALRTLLTSVLGASPDLSVEPPAPANPSEVKLKAASCLTVIGQGPGVQFAVLLNGPWLRLLSKAMLGEEVAAGDPAGENLVRELAGQTWGALRSSLAQAGAALPDVQFSLATPGLPLPDGILADDLTALSFTMSTSEQALTGAAVLSAMSGDAHASRQTAASPFNAAMPESTEPAVQVSPITFPELGGEQFRGDGGNVSFNLLADVDLEVTVELGRRKLPLADLLRLTTGSVVELEKFVGEPLEIYANGRFIAEGEAVVIDERFGIRITSLAATRQRPKAFV